MAKLGLSTTPSYPDLPLYLQDALCPDQARPMMAASGADLIGQTIRYRDKPNEWKLVYDYGQGQQRR